MNSTKSKLAFERINGFGIVSHYNGLMMVKVFELLSKLVLHLVLRIIMMRFCVMWYLCKLVIFYWVDLGCMIGMLCMMGIPMRILWS